MGGLSLSTVDTLLHQSDLHLTLKDVFLSVFYLFYELIDEKSKTWTCRFSASKNKQR